MPHFGPKGAWFGAGSENYAMLEEMHAGVGTADPPAAHANYVDTVAKATEAELKKIGVGAVQLPQVVLVPKVKTVKYKAPPITIAPVTMVPACIDLISPNECQQYWGGSSGAGQGIPGTLGPFGAGGAGPLNLPGTSASANVFLPVMGSLLVMVGKQVAAILATEGATELLNGILKRYNVPWIKFRFRSGKQNAQPFQGASSVKHGIPGATLWTADPESWAQI